MLSILVGMIPALVLRYIILKKPLGIGAAIAFAISLLIIGVIILESLGSKSMTLAGSIAAMSFIVLTIKSKEDQKKKEDEPK